MPYCRTITENVNWSELNKYGFINQLLNATRNSMYTLEIFADFGSDFPTTEVNQILYLQTLRGYTTAAASNSYNFAGLTNLRTVELTLKNPTPFVVDPFGSPTWFRDLTVSMKSVTIREAITANLTQIGRFLGLEHLEVWGNTMTNTWGQIRFPAELYNLTLANMPMNFNATIVPDITSSFSLLLKNLRFHFSKQTGIQKVLTIWAIPDSVVDLTVVGYDSSTVQWRNSEAAVPYGLTYLNLTNVLMGTNTVTNMAGLPPALTFVSGYLSKVELRLLHTPSNPLVGYLPFWSGGSIQSLIIDGFGWSSTRFNNDFCTLINGVYDYLSILKIYDSTKSDINADSLSCITLLDALEEVYFDRAPVTHMGYLPFYITSLHIDRPTSVIGHPPVTELDFETMAATYRYMFDDIRYNLPYLETLKITNGYENASFPFPAFELQLAKSLRVLDLSNNNISGTIPTRFLEHLAFMEIVNLNNNKMTGTFPWIANQWFREIHARDNNFTSWPTPYGFDRLNTVDFANNRHLTVFPNNVFLGGLAELLTIDVSGTERLVGPFASPIYNPESTLTSYNAEGSGLKGPLSTIFNTNLKSLSLKGSGVCGQLPDFHSSVFNPGLVHLDLAGTQISGTLPLSYGKFWDHLDLSATQVNGSAVPFYFHPTHPSYLNLSKLAGLTGDVFNFDDAGASWFPGRTTEVYLDGTSFDFCTSPNNLTSPFTCSVFADTNACDCESSYSMCSTTTCAKRSSRSESAQFIGLSRGSTLARQSSPCYLLEDFPDTPVLPPEEEAPGTIIVPSVIPQSPIDSEPPSASVRCDNPAPSVRAVCIGRNSWQVVGNLYIADLSISDGDRLWVQGNLTIAGQYGTLHFDSWKSYLVVEGCMIVEPLQHSPSWTATIRARDSDFNVFGSISKSFSLGEQRTRLINCRIAPELVTPPSAIKFRFVGARTNGLFELEVATVTQPSTVNPWKVNIRRNSDNLVVMLACVLTFGFLLFLFTFICMYYGLRK